MTNRALYDAALRLVSEIDLPNTNADYEERAGFLLPVICHRLAPLDKALRTSNNDMGYMIPYTIPWSLGDPFPLSDALLPAASALLASMLVIQENPELSDRLSKISLDAEQSVHASIPFSIEPIVNKYGQ